MKDFGNEDFSGDCFDIVGKIKDLDCRNPKDFVGTLEADKQDLCLGLGNRGDTGASGVLGTQRANKAIRTLGTFPLFGPIAPQADPSKDVLA